MNWFTISVSVLIAGLVIAVILLALKVRKLSKRSGHIPFDGPDPMHGRG